MTNLAVVSPPKPASAGLPSCPSLRELLRAGTSDRHVALDRLFEGMSVAPDPDLYHRFIIMNHACHGVLEPLLDGHAALDRAIGSHSRENLLPALASDMREMGLRPIEATVFPIHPIDLPAAAGIAYVLDGSRLGARFIHRDFKARDVARRWGGSSTAYLEAAAMSDAFRDRMAVLSAEVRTTADRAHALTAADAAFALFQNTISRLAPPLQYGMLQP